MDKFSEDVVISKFQALNNSQNSIQFTSSWVIAHKNDAKEIVKIWYKEFRKAVPKRKLMFLHLANDIIQNGRKKAPQFLSIYQAVLPVAFKEAAKAGDKKIRDSLIRLLTIWKDRNIYKKDFLEKIRSVVSKVIDKDSDTPDTAEVKTMEKVDIFDSVSVRDPRIKQKSSRNGSSVKLQESESTSVREELDLQIQKDFAGPVKTDELLKTLESILNPPSLDEVTRRTIASFPPEVSDPLSVTKLKYRPEAIILLEKVKNADTMLIEYNKKLETEMQQRRQLGPQIRTWLVFQTDAVKNLKNRLKGYKEDLEKAKLLRESLNSHLCNLPEITMDTEVSNSLNPLPTLDELFN